MPYAKNLMWIRALFVCLKYNILEFKTRFSSVDGEWDEVVFKKLITPSIFDMMLDDKDSQFIIESTCNVTPGGISRGRKIFLVLGIISEIDGTSSSTFKTQEYGEE